MSEQFSRTEILIGKEGLERLKNSYVAVFGVGGVGGYVVEALARSGVGRLDLIDNDNCELMNSIIKSIKGKIESCFKYCHSEPAVFQGEESL